MTPHEPDLDSDFDISRATRRLRRPRFVRQRDSSDCGAAALATVCGYFGRAPALSRVRRLARVSADGASMHSIAAAARHLGLRCAAVTAGFDHLSELRLPAITTLGYHFVVVDRADRSEVTIGDPAIGWRRLSREEFCREWNGAVLLFDAGPDCEARDWREPGVLSRLWKLIAPLRRGLASILLLTLVMNLVSLALPILTQVIVDRHLGGSGITPSGLVVCGAVALLLCALMQCVRSLMINRISCRLQRHLGERFLRHLLSLPLPYFLVRQTGDSVKRVDEIQNLSAFIGSQGAEALVDSVLAVFSLALVFYYSVQLGVILLSVGAVLLLASFLLGSVIYSGLLRTCQIQLEALILFIESVRKIALLKSCTAEALWLKRWKRKSDEAGKVLVRTRDIGSALSIVTESIFRATPLMVVLLGLRGSHGLSMGTLVSITSVIAVTLSSLLRLSAHYIEAQKTLLGAERIADVLDEQPEVGSASALDDRRHVRQTLAPPRIELRNVQFSYGDADDKAVLDGVDMVLEAGSTVAVVGPSGSGKTTLACLLCGVLRPTRGEILLDRRPLEAISIAQLRRRVALVPQDAALVQGTILENIALGEEYPDLSRAVRAARLAQAEEFILADALGYNRRLNEDGIGLSAGQRQRIAIARALYRDPEVLILDEPTSALDAESERALVRALQSLQGRFTLVLIVHRLNTVREVDLIYVLEGGRVVEFGAPDELASRAGRYRDLVRASEGREMLDYDIAHR
jgi:subfamily B ATP-binding cassette protein HlyB/CyaB